MLPPHSPCLRDAVASSGAACTRNLAQVGRGPNANAGPLRDVPRHTPNCVTCAHLRMACLADVTVPDEAEYSDFVKVSSEIMKGRNTLQQRLLIRNMLMSLLPPKSAEVFR